MSSIRSDLLPRTDKKSDDAALSVFTRCLSSRPGNISGTPAKSLRPRSGPRTVFPGPLEDPLSPRGGRSFPRPDRPDRAPERRCCAAPPVPPNSARPPGRPPPGRGAARQSPGRTAGTGSGRGDGQSDRSDRGPRPRRCAGSCLPSPGCPDAVDRAKRHGGQLRPDAGQDLGRRGMIQFAQRPLNGLFLSGVPFGGHFLRKFSLTRIILIKRITHFLSFVKCFSKKGGNFFRFGSRLFSSFFSSVPVPTFSLRLVFGWFSLFSLCLHSCACPFLLCVFALPPTFSPALPLPDLSLRPHPSAPPSALCRTPLCPSFPYIAFPFLPHHSGFPDPASRFLMPFPYLRTRENPDRSPVRAFLPL